MDAKAIFTEIKAFLDFNAEDEKRLGEIRPWVEENGPKITDAFYEILTSTPQLATYVEGRVEQLKKTHIQWMKELVTGPWDETYFQSRWKIGEAHVRIGLDPIWVDGTMALIRNKVIVDLAETESDAKKLSDAQASLIKACDLDLAIINIAYAEDRLDRLANFTGMKRALIENIIRLPKKE